MDLGSITQALGGLLGGNGQQQPQQQDGGGFSINPAMVAALAPAVMGLIKSQGGIGGIIDKFTGDGEEEQAKSWVADGPNRAVSPQQVRSALGDDVDRIAQQAGVPPAEAEAGLAQLLPKVIDTMTPGGQMPSNDDIGSIVGSLFK
jgi:uncharacterized protein YidB (DUF937 family)